jgi:hypothetical protein
LELSSIQTIANICAEEADRVADTSGFVPVRALAKRFRAEVIARPLLVEAMLATKTSPDSADATVSEKHWLILVDSERFAVTDNDVQDESPSRPLPPRLRNSIAHELVHSLSFRTATPTKKPPPNREKGDARDIAVRKLEKDAERLSPLLLIPYSSLVRLSRQSCLLPQTLRELQKRCAVSRDILPSRLTLLSIFDPEGIRYNTCLEDAAVGLGEWIDKNTAQLLDWPLFINFRENRVPDFVAGLSSVGDQLASGVCDDARFYLNGGDGDTVEFDVNNDARLPSYLRMRVRLNIEIVPRAAKAKFFFVVARVD